MGYNFMTADEAALFVKNGYKVGFSGFTAAGTPKEVPAAIARLAEAEHANQWRSVWQQQGYQQ